MIKLMRTVADVIEKAISAAQTDATARDLSEYGGTVYAYPEQQGWIVQSRKGRLTQICLLPDRPGYRIEYPEQLPPNLKIVKGPLL